EDSSSLAPELPTLSSTTRLAAELGLDSDACTGCAERLRVERPRPQRREFLRHVGGEFAGRLNPHHPSNAVQEVTAMASAVRGFVVALLVLLLGGTQLHAQEATVAGTVVDESKAVLPGVTVTATSLATGRQFSDVTSAQGAYRLVGVAAGRYKMQ